MSCGGPHDIPCSDVINAVFTFLDNEPTPLERSLIEHHFAECPPCQEEAEISALLKQLVARSCCEDPAPDQIRARITAQITQIQIEISRVQKDSQ